MAAAATGGDDAAATPASAAPSGVLLDITAEASNQQHKLGPVELGNPGAAGCTTPLQQSDLVQPAPAVAQPAAGNSGSSGGWSDEEDDDSPSWDLLGELADGPSLLEGAAPAAPQDGEGARLQQQAEPEELPPEQVAEQQLWCEPRQQQPQQAAELPAAAPATEEDWHDGEGHDWASPFVAGAPAVGAPAAAGLPASGQQTGGTTARRRRLRSMFADEEAQQVGAGGIRTWPSWTWAGSPREARHVAWQYTGLVSPTAVSPLWLAALQGTAGGWAAATPAGGGTAAGEDSEGDADLIAVPWSTRGKGPGAATAATAFKRLRREAVAAAGAPMRQQEGQHEEQQHGQREWEQEGQEHGQQQRQQEGQQEGQALSGPADAVFAAPRSAEGAQPAATVPSPVTGRGTAARAPLRLQHSSPQEARLEPEGQAGSGPLAAAAAGEAEGAEQAAAAKPTGNPFARTGAAGKGSVSAQGKGEWPMAYAMPAMPACLPACVCVC